MKKVIKTLMICAIILFIGMSNVPFFATTLSQDGLEVTFTTDKQEYKKDLQI